VALANGTKSFLFLDPNAKNGEQFLGFPSVRKLEGSLAQGWSCLPAAGDNSQRQKQFEFAWSKGWPIATVIATSATVHFDAKIAAGTFIGHHAHVGPSAAIGKACIINTGAIVEHESIVGDYTHVSVNAVIAGRSRIGDFVFLGAGATAIDSISIGDRITVGAGATVVDDLTEPGTYVGSPAKLITR
jgi:UDP-N-acetylbacillosamine N-acetyltransferase